MIKYIENFWKYKDLLVQLVLRDLKTKYRRSILGYIWSVLNPLLMMLVITIVFSSLFKFDIPNFPIYLLIGQLMFNFFSEATTAAMNSIIGNDSLLKKVYIPKYIFPVARSISAFVNLLFSLIAIVIVLIITKTPVYITALLFPLALLYLLLFSIGIGLMLSVAATYFRDVIHLYSILLTAWLYLTPIFYPIKILPHNVKTIVLYNPLFHFIEFFRSIILYGEVPNLSSNLICFGYGSISLTAGIIIFFKNQNNLILYT